MKTRIEVGICCGSSCAKYYEDGYMTHHERYYGEWYIKYGHAPMFSEEEDIAAWHAKREALLKLLKKLVEEGKLTQEQADAELAQWEKENPNPDPEEQPINVTEEFERPIPVTIPERIEREADAK